MGSYVTLTFLKFVAHILTTNMANCLAQVPGNAAIRQIVFSRNGQFLLTNSTDRILRVFENLLPRDGAAKALASLIDQKEQGATMSRDVPCLKFTKDFQDAVNKMHWKAACFNGDGECVVGASANKGEHKIHIWNRLLQIYLNLGYIMQQYQ